MDRWLSDNEGWSADVLRDITNIVSEILRVTNNNLPMVLSTNCPAEQYNRR